MKRVAGDGNFLLRSTATIMENDGNDECRRGAWRSPVWGEVTL
jgi:hypothetical protein